MSKPVYTPRRTGNDVLDRNLDDIATAIGALADAILPTSTYAGFVRLGSNGIGTLALAPLKGPDGRILQRATVGSRVMAVVNLTTPGVVTTSFEPTITTADQIKQTATTNLSAANLLFLLVN